MIPVGTVGGEPANVEVFPDVVRLRLVVAGIVQGVGFRPFVHRLAHRFGLNGWVLNSTEGVVIEVEGETRAVEEFAGAIPLEAPPRATVERIDSTLLPPIGYRSFAIEPSQEQEGHFSPISPDICICEDCLRELRDPADRRYRYPFINCTNCGPRLTIVRDIPYDRPKTTVACFPMCPDCEAEYHDPTNRRFHAQPNGCPVCGPRLWLVWRKGGLGADAAGGAALRETEVLGDAAIDAARALLSRGAILAIKGLGGFHLACDATNDAAVAELRRRKRRSDKPFALMSADAEAVASYCHLSDQERRLLESPQRPIVLLKRREDATAPWERRRLACPDPGSTGVSPAGSWARGRPASAISGLVAPGNRFLGVMLPYTPLHYLLTTPDRPPGGPGAPPLALVMTSGNLSEEPIATGNRDALGRLDGLADAFLLHDRDIQVRCDDSVTRLFRGSETVIRRSRGYAPFPVRLAHEARDLLACGGQLKNTFCITKGNYAFLSQHIGDLENAETLASFASSVEHFRRIFRLEVQAVAHDMHPDYLSTRYAWELAERAALPLVPVQHHHAHIAACMAENGVDEPAIGIAFDGTGYGDDGHLWGGEFLVCDLSGYRRAAHLKYLPLPGGEVAVRRPYRMAASYLFDSFGPDALHDGLPPLRQISAAELAVLQRQIERGLNSPLTSSAGRLFDAVSSILDLRHTVNYEGQAAIELEMVATEGVSDRYDWHLEPGEPAIVDVSPAIRKVVRDWREDVPIALISARFHNTVADVIVRCCDWLRHETGLSAVALSGGVFQNVLLLEQACHLLEDHGFRVLIHHQVPANDGGISLGQAVVANRLLQQK